MPLYMWHANKVSYIILTASRIGVLMHFKFQYATKMIYIYE